MSTDSANTMASEAIAKIEFSNEDFKDNVHFKCFMIMMYSFRGPYSQTGCQSDAGFRNGLNPLGPVGFIGECPVFLLQPSDTRHTSENDYHSVCKSLPLLAWHKLTHNLAPDRPEREICLFTLARFARPVVRPRSNACQVLAEEK